MFFFFTTIVFEPPSSFVRSFRYVSYNSIWYIHIIWTFCGTSTTISVCGSNCRSKCVDTRDKRTTPTVVHKGVTTSHLIILFWYKYLRIFSLLIKKLNAPLSQILNFVEDLVRGKNSKGVITHQFRWKTRMRMDMNRITQSR